MESGRARAAQRGVHPVTGFVLKVAGSLFVAAQIVLAAGLLHASILPAWVAVAAGLLGLAAIGVTMAKPDELELYRPIFHLNPAWMLVLGLVMLRAGIRAAG